MRSKRILSVSMAAILGITLAVILTLILAIGPVSSQETEETQKEMEKAVGAERNPGVVQHPVVLEKGLSSDYPLFMGVDDNTVPAFRMDPTTNLFTEAFVGVEVWGSAYDAEDERVLFNLGSTLWEWQVQSGTPMTLGKILDPGGSVLVMVGLAHYDGTLYGSRNIANEAIWAIDTQTQ